MVKFLRSAMLRPVTMVVLAAVLAWLPSVALGAGAIGQSYPTNSTDIAPGTLLSLDRTGGNKVSPARSSDTAAALVGVAASEPLLQLSNSSQASVQVAVSGTTSALVSNINGDVAVGDKIALSPIAGIGMKAVLASEIVGTAQAALSSVATTTRTVTDHTGKKVLVKIGLVPVSVNVEFYSAGSSSTLSAFVPAFLQNVANVIAGKPVSPLRVLIALLVLATGAVIVIVMLNTAIHSGIISLGRNPLAEKALLKGLVDVILAALGVLLITFVVAYAVLST